MINFVFVSLRFGGAGRGGFFFTRDNSTNYDNNNILAKRRDAKRVGIEIVLSITE